MKKDFIQGFGIAFTKAWQLFHKSVRIRLIRVPPRSRLCLKTPIFSLEMLAEGTKAYLFRVKVDFRSFGKLQTCFETKPNISPDRFAMD